MEENNSQPNKNNAALAKYNTNLSDADIQARVAELIEKKVPALYLLGCELFSSMIFQFWVVDMSFIISFRFLIHAFLESSGYVYTCLVGNAEKHP